MHVRPFRAIAVRFLVPQLLVLAVVASAAVGWSAVAARSRALHETALAARTIATALAAPRCTPALTRGDADAVGELDRVVRNQLRDGSILRVKVWTPEGRIVYSDATALIGRSFDLEKEEADLFGTSGAVAQVSTLGRAENDLEAAAGHLVEAYAGITGTDGNPLLFEAYYVVGSVLGALSDGDTWTLIPLALVAVFGLGLLQVPLVLRLAGTIHSAHVRRRRRLRYASTRADLENARIARDLRDGVVQDLAGVAYLLDALAGGSADRADRMITRAGTLVRDDLRRLRRTVDDLSQPDLARTGLRPALADLLGPLRAAGVRCELVCTGPVGNEPALDEETMRLLHRVARELLRDAGPGPVRVELAGTGLTVSGAGGSDGLLPMAVRDAGGTYERTGGVVRVALN